MYLYTYIHIQLENENGLSSANLEKLFRVNICTTYNKKP